MNETEKTPCPRCGSKPVMSRHGSRYWKAMFPNDQGLHRVVGHPTKQAKPRPRKAELVRTRAIVREKLYG